MPLTVKAFAKINLTLDVLGKRPDGYHNVDMVMQSISLCDQIVLEKNSLEGIALSCNRRDIPTNESNTAYKAAKLFFDYAGIKKGATIYINKKIPSQAGLGGGSADAAAVLHGLNNVFEAGFSLDELCEVAKHVGSDVPFCVHGGTMLATGTGTTLSALSPMPYCVYIVIKPPVDVSTAEAYRRCDLRDLSDKKTHSTMLIRAIEDEDIAEISKHLYNDFEEVMDILLVSQIKNTLLKKGAKGALMTGSGSAVYGVFDNIDTAAECGRYIARTMKSCEVFMEENTTTGCIVEKA